MPQTATSFDCPTPTTPARADAGGSRLSSGHFFKLALVLCADSVRPGARHLHHDAAVADRSSAAARRRSREPVDLRGCACRSRARSAAAGAVPALSRNGTLRQFRPVDLSTGQPVAKDIARTFPATIELATAAIILRCRHRACRSALPPPCGRAAWVDSAARFVVVVRLFGADLLARPADASALLRSPALGAGPGRADVVFQYTVKPISGFALIDTWISGKTDAF